MVSRHCMACGADFEPTQHFDSARVRSNVRYFKNESFTVWRCPSCRSLHSLEEVDLNKFYARYPFKEHVLDLPTRLAYRNRYKFLKGLGITPDSLILDYGCGAGLYVDYLKQLGFRQVFGYDSFNPQYNRPEVLNRSYDLITAYDLIEHVQAPAEMLQRFKSQLKPGGMLILGTPNAEAIQLNQVEKFLPELHQPYHRHILSEQALIKLASDYEFEPIRLSRRFYFDTLFPFINTRFIWEYMRAQGNWIDSVLEGLDFKKILNSRQLLFYAFFGYFFPPRGNIVLLFRRSDIQSFKEAAVLSDAVGV